MSQDDRVVSYPVFLRRTKVGYLFAGQVNGRSGFVVILGAMDDDARIRAAAVWDDRLTTGVAEKLTPLEKLEHWKGAPEDPWAGAVPVDAELSEFAHLHELEQAANPGHVQPPPLPLSPYARPDWGPVAANGAQLRYRTSADGPVLYRLVRLGDRVIGFLWISEAERAFGYVSRSHPTADEETVQEWWDVQSEIMAVSFHPVSEALDMRVGFQEDPIGGRLEEADGVKGVAGLQDLQELARGPWPPEP